MIFRHPRLQVVITCNYELYSAIPASAARAPSVRTAAQATSAQSPALPALVSEPRPSQSAQPENTHAPTPTSCNIYTTRPYSYLTNTDLLKIFSQCYMCADAKYEYKLLSFLV